MKKILSFFCLLIFSYSCEKSDHIAKNTLNTDFSKKILDGYFVISIAFDNNGNAWIGTFKQGLIKYNSNETVVYNSGNSIIPEDAVIWDIEADSKNNVWIGCEGLIKYNGKNFTYYNSSNTPMPENNVMSVTIDSKDNIWFSSCVNKNGGIVKFNGESWLIFTPDNSELPTNLINDIAVDKNDNIWVTTHSQTLSKISNDRLTTYTFNSLNGAYYSLGDIAVNKKNDICIVINNGAFSGGIWACKDCSKILIFNELKSEELYNDNIILNIKSMFIDSDDNIWCIDYDYFTIYNGKDWISDSKDLEGDLFSIAQAFNGNIWIGTGNGIYINEIVY
jgi:ligand-binding sensor domain-containing protein